MQNQIKRIQEVTQITGLSKSTIYAMIKEERFPAPLRIGRRAVGWTDDMIENWMTSLRDSSRNA